MYGYITPIKTELSQADFCLYRAFYCGMCVATKQMFGQLPRLTTNYDMAFLSVLLCDFAQENMAFYSCRCICNPKKKAVVCRNALFEKLVALNVLLAYHKADDDVIDGGGLKKRFVRRVLKKHYLRAAAMLPEADEIVRAEYARLRAFEKENAQGVDRVADCFASMMQALGTLITGTENEQMQKLLYNVGKFVYLADALDDVDEDFRKKRYNPLLSTFGGYENRRQFIEDNRAALTFMLASTVNRAIECFNAIEFKGAHDLLKNVLHRGMREKCTALLESKKKLRPPRL